MNVLAPNPAPQLGGAGSVATVENCEEDPEPPVNIQNSVTITLSVLAVSKH